MNREEELQYYRWLLESYEYQQKLLAMYVPRVKEQIKRLEEALAEEE
jgi:hypothetical protein